MTITKAKSIAITKHEIPKKNGEKGNYKVIIC